MQSFRHTSTSSETSVSGQMECRGSRAPAKGRESRSGGLAKRYTSRKASTDIFTELLVDIELLPEPVDTNSNIELNFI